MSIERTARLTTGTLFVGRINPRTTHDAGPQAGLVASIRAHGILVPLLVRPEAVRVDGSADAVEVTPARYEVIAGSRRLAAAQEIGLPSVPCIIYTCADDEARTLALDDNLQRADMTPLEEAAAVQQLLETNPGSESPASIARRLSRPEAWAWDRLALLKLVPEARTLLERKVIGPDHAVLIARLTPEQQLAVIHPHDGGLFKPEQVLFTGAASDDAEDEQDPYAGLRPVTLRELRSYIARHIRFQPAVAAQVAPLDFGPTQLAIAEAEEQPGRGRKVIPITREYHVHPSARAEERTYCVSAWKRADGREGSKPCDHAILGVVVTGPGQGESFPVCVRKECDVHWKKERRERERRAKGGQVDATAQGKKPAWQVKEERRDRERKAWARLMPGMLRAFATYLGAVKFSAALVREVLATHRLKAVQEDFGVELTEKTAAAVLVLNAVDQWDRASFIRSVKPFKFDVRAAQQAVEKALKAEEGKTADPTAAATEPGTCRECGCTEDAACEGGCAWADESCTLCTRCVTKTPTRKAGGKKAAPKGTTPQKNKPTARSSAARRGRTTKTLVEKSIARRSKTRRRVA